MESMKCPSCGSPNLQKTNSTEYKCDNCKTSSKLSNDQTTLVILNGSPCPNCGFFNESDVRFCGDCGTKLVKTCKLCNKETRIDRKFCPNCGKSEFDMDEISSSGFFDVILMPGNQRINEKVEIIKFLRRLLNLGLREAKTFAENKSVIASHLTIEEANDLKDQFEKFNCKIEITRYEEQQALSKKSELVFKGIYDSGFYDVTLKPGNQKNREKAEIIMLLKKIKNLGLWEARTAVQSSSVLATHVSIDEANNLKNQFENFHGIVEITPSSGK